jgi:hypothetical protein
MSNKVLRLEMSFPTSNDLIDGFNSIFCSWGQIKTPKDSNGNIRGIIFKIKRFDKVGQLHCGRIQAIHFSE